MCLGDATQQHNEESLGQRLLKGMSVLRSLIATGFTLPTASKCWGQFYIICKTGKFLIWDILGIELGAGQLLS